MLAKAVELQFKTVWTLISEMSNDYEIDNRQNIETFPKVIDGYIHNRLVIQYLALSLSHSLSLVHFLISFAFYKTADA